MRGKLRMRTGGQEGQTRRGCPPQAGLARERGWGDLGKQGQGALMYAPVWLRSYMPGHSGPHVLLTQRDICPISPFSTWAPAPRHSSQSPTRLAPVHLRHGRPPRHHLRNQRVPVHGVGLHLVGPGWQRGQLRGHRGVQAPVHSVFNTRGRGAPYGTRRAERAAARERGIQEAQYRYPFRSQVAFMTLYTLDQGGQRGQLVGRGSWWGRRGPKYYQTEGDGGMHHVR